MHASEVNRVKREIGQLVKAEKDMQLVAESASSASATGRWSRIEEAGLIVTYGRAYTLDSKRREPITLSLLPPPSRLRTLHDRLMALRDTLYAHSDEGPERVVVDPFGDHRYTEGYRPLDVSSFPRIGELARHQATRFRLAREERQNALRNAGVPADAL